MAGRQLVCITSGCWRIILQPTQSQGLLQNHHHCCHGLTIHILGHISSHKVFPIGWKCTSAELYLLYLLVKKCCKNCPKNCTFSRTIEHLNIPVIIMGKGKDKEKEVDEEDVGVEANPPWRPIDCWGSHRSLQAAPSISAHTLSHLQLFAHQHTHHHRDDDWSS